MKENTEKSQKKTKLEKVIFIIEIILIAIVAVWLVAMIITKITGGEPELFGYKLYYVQTGSMSPAIEAGDAILARKFSPGEELQTGDIVCYSGSGKLEGQSVTHRIVSIEGEPGSRTVTTRGDANNVDDSPIGESRIIAKYVRRLSLIGKIVAFLRSKGGIWVVWICVGAFAAYALFGLVRNLRDPEEKAPDEAAGKDENAPDGKPDDTENK